MKLFALPLLLAGLCAGIASPAQAQGNIGSPIPIPTFDQPATPGCGYLNDVFLVTWVDRLGANTNTRLYGRFYRFDGASLTGNFVIDPLMVADPDARVSTTGFNSALGDYFLVAWEKAGGLYVCVLESGVVPSSAPHLINVGAGITNDIDPETGPASSYATVVWTREGHGIRYANVAPNGAGDALIMQTASVSTGVFDENPSIVRSDACGDTRFVVWHSNPGPGNEIKGRMWDGGFPNSNDVELTIKANTFLPYSSPCVGASSPEDFVVAWSFLTNGSMDVEGRRIHYPGGVGNAATLGTPRALYGATGADETRPQIVFTGNAYLVTAVSDNGFERLFAKAVDPMNLNNLGSMTVDFNGVVDYTSYTLASRTTEANGLDEALVAFAEPAIKVQRFENEGALVEYFPDSGCDLLGGETRISMGTGGNPDFQVELWGGEPATGAYLYIGRTPGFTPLGGATLVPLPGSSRIFYAGVTTLDGYAKLDFALPDFPGVNILAQYRTLTQGASCAGSQYNIADGLRFTID